MREEAEGTRGKQVLEGTRIAVGSGRNSSDRGTESRSEGVQRDSASDKSGGIPWTIGLQIQVPSRGLHRSRWRVHARGGDERDDVDHGRWR